MEINNKDIWRDEKKYCIICNKEYYVSGIQILGNFICEECVKRLNIIDIGSDEYEIIKEKIKNALGNKISK